MADPIWDNTGLQLTVTRTLYLRWIKSCYRCELTFMEDTFQCGWLSKCINTKFNDSFLPKLASSISRSLARCSSVYTTIFVRRKDKIRHELSVAFHEITTSWKLVGGPYTYVLSHLMRYVCNIFLLPWQTLECCSVSINCIPCLALDIYLWVFLTYTVTMFRNFILFVTNSTGWALDNLNSVSVCRYKWSLSQPQVISAWSDGYR